MKRRIFVVLENSSGCLFGGERGGDKRFGRRRKRRIAELIFIGGIDRAHPAVYAPKPLDLARIRAPSFPRSVRYNRLSARLAICRKSSEGIWSRRRFNPFLPRVKHFFTAGWLSISFPSSRIFFAVLSAAELSFIYIVIWYIVIYQWAESKKKLCLRGEIDFEIRIESPRRESQREIRSAKKCSSIRV